MRKLKNASFTLFLVFSVLAVAEAQTPRLQPRDVTQGSSAVTVETLAVVGKLSITATQLAEIVEGRLIRIKTEEYNIKRRALDDLIAQKLLEQEAASRKISPEELTRAAIENSARPVTEEEVRAVYESASDRFRGIPEALALKQIESGMRQQRVNKRRSEFVKELWAKAGVKVLLEPARLTVDSGDAPARGLQTAPVTIVEFSEFQCPFCSQVQSTLKQLEERYGDKVRIIFRNFPLPMHREARKAAEAAGCADEQQRFWTMHDKLFASQNSLQVSDLKRYALETKLDVELFNECLDSGKYATKVQRDMNDGSRYGVSSTPTFFINGRLVTGAAPYEAFKQVIDEELERAGLLHLLQDPSPDKRAQSSPTSRE